MSYSEFLSYMLMFLFIGIVIGYSLNIISQYIINSRFYYKITPKITKIKKVQHHD